MKYIAIFLIFMMNNCKSVDSNSVSKLTNNEKMNLQEQNCPDNGTCKVEIMKNKSLRLLKDGIGKMYPKVVDGDNIVIQYTFTKGNPNNYQDGHDSETLHIEINANTLNELVDNDLQQVNLLYGKHCFCKDIVGYYPIKKGQFLMQTLKDGKMQLKINFSEPKVGDRQFLKSIDLVLK